MRVYLDMCVYNRPFDDQRQQRIEIETLEFLFLLSKAANKELELVGSFVLDAENSNNPYIDRRVIITDILRSAGTYVSYGESLEKRAKTLERFGIMGMDALHIACAEHGKADFFVTCDDELVKRCRGHKQTIKIKAAPLMKFMTGEVFKI